jgi:hypothetical protein
VVTKNVVVAGIVSLAIAVVQAQNVLNLSVLDANYKPLENFSLSLAGGGSGTSDVNGQAMLALPRDAKAGSTVLVILVAPPQYVIFSPFDHYVVVPANGSAPVFLCKRPCKDTLAGSRQLGAVVARITASGTVGVPPARGVDSGAKPTREMLQSARDTATITVLKDLDIELATFDRAVEEIGRRAEDPYVRGVTLLYRLDQLNAIKALDAAVDARPSDKPEPGDRADAYFFRAQARSELGDFASAVKDLEQAIRLRGTDPFVLRAFGAALIRSGQTATGQARIREAQGIIDRGRGGRQ